MKKIISIISVLAAAASLTACSDINSPAENSSGDPTSSQGSTSSQSTTSMQSTMSSEVPSSSENKNLWSSYPEDSDLKGEKLAAKFEWPYDDPIDLRNATVKRYVEGSDVIGQYEIISLSEISEKSAWNITCDYGYLAMTPKKDGKYEYKKYQVGDEICGLKVSNIQTYFDNSNYEFMKYFVGVKAEFDGEITLVGKCRLSKADYGLPSPLSDIEFIPNEESCKKLPIVHFLNKTDIPTKDEYYQRVCEMTDIFLGNIEDYPNIDISKFPDDGSFINVKVTIKNYGYRAIFSLPFNGFAEIVDLEVL